AQRRRGRDPLPLGVVSTTLAASTDFGNVSFRVPGIHPVIKIAPHEVALHTREFATAAVSELARSAAADGAYGLAATVLDVQHEVRLAEAVAAEFTAAGGAIDVPSSFDCCDRRDGPSRPPPDLPARRPPPRPISVPAPQETLVSTASTQP